MALSPDSNLLACDDGRTIRLFDMTHNGLQRSLKGHKYAITAVEWLPDGKLLAWASADGTVRLWDVASGKAGFALLRQRLLQRI